MTQTEEEQVSAAVSGDGDALALLLQQHGPAIRRGLHINPVWQGTLDSADVMQVTYLEAFLRINLLQTRTRDGFVAWLTRLARNNLRDAIRELGRAKRPNPRRRLARPAHADSGTTLLNALAHTSATASRSAARHESAEALMSALGRLPPLYSEVLRMHDLEGRPAAEVATILGRSTGAVHMLRARAIDRLKELLGPESLFFSKGA